MPFRILTLLALFLVPFFAADVLAGVAPQTKSTGDEETVRISGLVVERQKYSFVIQDMDRHIRVELPNSVPVLLRLNRPVIDLQQREVRMPLSTSAADGNPINDELLTLPLGEKVFVSTRFENSDQKKTFLGNRVLAIRDFELTMTQPPIDDLMFSGQLVESSVEGQFRIDTGASNYSATLDKRKGLLSGFSILDLKPLETIARVEGRMEGDRLIASRIRFDHLGQPDRHFEANLPRVLSLGDQTSYCYHQPFVEALAGKINVFHPPMWTGASKQWDRLHHYLGDLRRSESGTPNWDAIVFSFGVRDQNESKENFQSNLRNAIELLEKSKARLIWVTATPVPKGYPEGVTKVGYVQGRMKLQNEWANEVLNDYPEIVVCDLWQLVKDGTSGDFENWWSRKYLNFTYAESIPLGRQLAKYVMIALATDDQELNPPSVHRLSTDTASR